MPKQLYLITVLLLATALFCGCQAETPLDGDLMTNIQAEKQTAPPPQTTQEEKDRAIAVYDFTVRLFNADPDNATQNTLISPLSVLLTLSMTANGAADSTLAQMETAFGLPLAELNSYLQYYVENLPQNKTASLYLANSIWLNDDLDITVKQDFLQTNADYYGADVYQLPFNDDALNQINAWVNQNTNGLIDRISDQIPPDAALYLVNALTFDAEWEEMYTERQVRQDIFTTADGKEQQVDFMYGTADVYLQDENTRGFIKYYAGRDYAFVALLPNEDMPLADYAAALTGEKLYRLLKNQRQQFFFTSIPKFENEFTLGLISQLQNMGITDAFDPYLANFSGIADYPLYINQVLHKTYIRLDERGTQAGAVTEVSLEPGSMPDPEEIYLNRPFIYLLIDCRSKLPLFIGAVTDLE